MASIDHPAPPILLHADGAALAALARRKWGLAAFSWLVAGAIATAILVVEYRLMLFAIVAVAVPLVASIAAWATARSARIDGFVTVELHPEGVLVRTSARELRAAYGPTASFAAARDVLVVAIASDGRWRRWEVPGAPDAVLRMADALRARGSSVKEEPGLGALAAFLGGVVMTKVLGVVAAGLVLGALANIVLAIAGKGGSLLLGFALLGGALGSLVVSALLQIATGARGAE